MAVTFLAGGAVASTEGDSPRTLSIATPAGDATNRLLLVAVCGRGPSEIIASAAYAAQGNLDLVVDNAPLYLLAKKAPTAGTNDLTVTLADGYGQAIVMWAVFDGVDQTTPYGTPFAPDHASTNAPSTGSQTCPAGGMLFAAVWHSYATAVPTGTLGTLIGAYREASADTGHAASYRADTGALSWSMNQSASGPMAGVGIIAAGGGGSDVSGTTTIGDLQATGTIEGGSTLTGTATPDVLVSTGTIDAPNSLTGTAEPDALASSGQILGGSTISGTSEPDQLQASGTITAAAGTFTTDPLARNNNTLAPNSPLTWLGFRVHATGAPVLLLTGQSTDASAVISVTHGSLSPGTVYRADWLEASGEYGHWVAAAT